MYTKLPPSDQPGPASPIDGDLWARVAALLSPCVAGRLRGVCTATRSHVGPCVRASQLHAIFIDPAPSLDLCVELAALDADLFADPDTCCALLRSGRSRTASGGHCTDGLVHMPMAVAQAAVDALVTADAPLEWVLAAVTGTLRVATERIAAHTAIPHANHHWGLGWESSSRLLGVKSTANFIRDGRKRFAFCVGPELWDPLTDALARGVLAPPVIDRLAAVLGLAPCLATLLVGGGGEPHFALWDATVAKLEPRALTLHNLWELIECLPPAQCTEQRWAALIDVDPGVFPPPHHTAHLAKGLSTDERGRLARAAQAGYAKRCAGHSTRE